MLIVFHEHRREKAHGFDLNALFDAKLAGGRANHREIRRPREDGDSLERAVFVEKEFLARREGLLKDHSLPFKDRSIEERPIKLYLPARLRDLCAERRSEERRVG